MPNTSHTAPDASLSKPPFVVQSTASFASGLVLSRCVQDPVRVNIESDLNLEHVTWRWWDPIEMELPKQIVVLGRHTLSLEDLKESIKLVACVRRERLSLLRGNGGVGVR